MSASWRGHHPMLERSRRPARPPVDWVKVAILLVVVLADLAILVLLVCAAWWLL